MRILLTTRDRRSTVLINMLRNSASGPKNASSVRVHGAICTVGQ
jgi:hypothetical protein